MKITGLKAKFRNMYLGIFLVLFVYGLLTSVTYVNNNQFSGINFNILSIGVMVYSGYMIVTVFMKRKPLMYGTFQYFVFHNSMLKKQEVTLDQIVRVEEAPDKNNILYIITSVKTFVLNLNMYNITKEELIDKYQLQKIKDDETVYEAPKSDELDEYDF